MSENTFSDEYDMDTNDLSENTSEWATPTSSDDDSEEIQRKYLYAIKSCNIVTVRDLLEKRDILGFDLNCKNYQGMTGLNVAIQANYEQMVDLLVSQPRIEIGDSLMHAIRENHYPIVIKLLDILQSKDPEKVLLGYENSIEFPQYLTPLMLASQCGHYKIISLLLKRGHIIPIPHKPRCFCKDVSRIYIYIYRTIIKYFSSFSDYKISITCTWCVHRYANHWLSSITVSERPN